MVCRANSKIRMHSCACRDLAGIVQTRPAVFFCICWRQSPARRARRRRSVVARIRPRQAPLLSQSVPKRSLISVAPIALVAGPVCALHAPGRLIRAVIVFKPSTLLPPSSSADPADVSPALLVHGPTKPGQGPESESG